MKVYEKPRVYIERFELSESIATCAFDMANSQDVNNCTAVGDEKILPGTIYADAAGQTIFSGTNAACKVGFDIYCYTDATPETNIFNS